MRSFRNIFLTKDKRRKRRESEAMSIAQKDKMSVEDIIVKPTSDQEETMMVMSSDEVGPEEKQTCPANYSSHNTNPEDDVFHRQASLPAGSRKHTIRMRKTASHVRVASLRSSTRSLPVKSQECTASDTETACQINDDTSLQGSQSESVFGSQTLVKEDRAVFSSPGGGQSSRHFFLSDSHDDGDKYPRQHYRSRADSKSHIKVKYTKIYGEKDGAYKNDSVPRGLIFMCNFAKFKDDKQSERIGSEQDYENLLDLFHQMGYGQRNRREKYCCTGYISKDEFMQRLEAFSRDKKHQMSCSCIIIIMSHGSGPKTFLTSDNQEVDLMDVYSIFDNINCNFLKGKPKIFILQFCRSQIINKQFENLVTPEDMLRKIVREEMAKYNPKIPMLQVIQDVNRKTSTSSAPSLTMDVTHYPDLEMQQLETSQLLQVDGRHMPPQLPHEGLQRYSDMYSIFSTASGELSHRDPRKGSLLVQAICHIFAENAYHDDIETLVRKVSTYMTRTLQRDDPIHVPRQTCERTNNGLDKTFYFNPHQQTYCRHKTI